MFAILVNKVNCYFGVSDGESHEAPGQVKVVHLNAVSSVELLHHVHVNGRANQRAAATGNYIINVTVVNLAEML